MAIPMPSERLMPMSRLRSNRMKRLKAREKRRPR